MTFLLGTGVGKIRDELRTKIEELENLRLEYYLILERKILEGLRAGRTVDSRLLDFSGMKERYLEALDVYGSFGLTPCELYEKRSVWLCRTGEKMGTSRIKTISMFLRRLHLNGLARRQKEGRTYRYFISMSGRRRLSYYRNRDKNARNLRSMSKNLG